MTGAPRREEKSTGRCRLDGDAEREREALHERIIACRLGGEGYGSFVSRLERDNGWSRSFALRAIAEYRRFVFLAVTSGHRVSPSDVVDQVWHLHLQYTRSYWDDFCRCTLRRPLHHEPATGGRRMQGELLAAYAATLDSYARRFEDRPPPDIWPDPGARGVPECRFQRVDQRRCYIVPGAT